MLHVLYPHEYKHFTSYSGVQIKDYKAYSLFVNMRDWVDCFKLQYMLQSCLILDKFEVQNQREDKLKIKLGK